jgi:class 3 adenylate cyclase
MSELTGNELTGTTGLRYRNLRTIAIVVATVGITGFLVIVGQPVAAGLIPLIAGLLLVIEQRNARAQALARLIDARQMIDKLEVPPGAWGDLSRAINGLMQERRVEQRIRSLSAAALPNDAIEALLNGGLRRAAEPRHVAVLLVSFGGAHQLNPPARHAALQAWQALADAARQQAHMHDALLQPCGDTIMLVFGAFSDRPADAALHAALGAANALRRIWSDIGVGAGKPLAISLAAGPALIAMLPGLGCCVLGTPVEQALQIERFALSAPHNRLLCSESAYYVLRRANGTGWSPTEYRALGSDGKTHVVYSWNGYAFEQ